MNQQVLIQFSNLERKQTAAVYAARTLCLSMCIKILSIGVFLFSTISIIGQEYNLIHDGWPWSSAEGVIELSTGEIFHFGYKDGINRAVLSNRIGGAIWKTFLQPEQRGIIGGGILARERGDSLDILMYNGEVYRGSQITGDFQPSKNQPLLKSKAHYLVTSENGSELFVAGMIDTNTIIFIINEDYEIQDSILLDGYIYDMEHDEELLYILSSDVDSTFLSLVSRRSKNIEERYSYPKWSIWDIEIVGEDVFIAGFKKDSAYIGRINSQRIEEPILIVSNHDYREAYIKLVELKNKNIGAIYKGFPGFLQQTPVLIEEIDRKGEVVWFTELDVSRSSIEVHDLITTEAGTMIVAGEAGSSDVGRQNWAFVAETNELSMAVNNKPDKPRLKIIPNPASENFRVLGASHNSEFTLVDVDGRPIEKRNDGEFNITNLNVGVYVVKVNDGNEESIMKVVKHK